MVHVHNDKERRWGEVCSWLGTLAFCDFVLRIIIFTVMKMILSASWCVVPTRSQASFVYSDSRHISSCKSCINYVQLHCCFDKKIYIVTVVMWLFSHVLRWNHQLTKLGLFINTRNGLQNCKNHEKRMWVVTLSFHHFLDLDSFPSKWGMRKCYQPCTWMKCYEMCEMFAAESFQKRSTPMLQRYALQAVHQVFDARRFCIKTISSGFEIQGRSPELVLGRRT